MSQLTKKVLGAGAAMVALSAFVPNPFTVGEALAQATAQDTMNVTAKVINPLKVNQVTKMNFGSFAVGTSAAVIKLTPAGAITVPTGDAILIAGQVAGQVSFQAPKSVKFTISIPALAAGVKLTTGGGGAVSKSMTLTKVTLKSTATTKMKINNVQTAAFTSASFKKTAKLLATAGVNGKANVGGYLSGIGSTNIVGTYVGTYACVTTL